MKRFMKFASGVIGAIAMVTAAMPATAGTWLITGTRQNVNPLNPPGTGRCAPATTVNIAPGMVSSTGTSNFGAFTSTQSHCIAGPPPNPLFNGIFTYDFGGGNTLSGTYIGLTSLSATPGVFDAQEFLTIGSGTGKFLGASGFINTVGSLTRTGGYGYYSGTLSGSVTAPQLPEPGTWGMMIGGLGAAGGLLRLRRRELLHARA